MFRRLFISTLACSMIASSFLQATPLAIQPGEKFTYRLAWGPFRQAASLEIVAEVDPDSPENHTRITTHTATRGMIRALYRFDGWGQFVYEPNAGRLMRAEAWTETSSKETKATITLDYEQMKANYEDHLRPARSLQMDIPTEQAFDFLTTLVQMRAWNLNLGEQLPVPVYFDDEVYPLVISVVERTTIKTPLGKREVLLVTPHMPENPKGMFEDGGEIRVWVSDDELRLPLKFEVKMPVGTGMALLMEHTPANATDVAQSRQSKSNMP